MCTFHGGNTPSLQTVRVVNYKWKARLTGLVRHVTRKLPEGVSHGPLSVSSWWMFDKVIN